MKITKQLGIWMDHSTAHLMEASNGPIVTTTIESEFTHREKERTLIKGEHMMHNTEQQKQQAYYKKLGDVIKDYDQVLLFGPTHAKDELANMLKEDRGFKESKIHIRHADKMTENQRHAFVKDHFKHALYAV